MSGETIFQAAGQAPSSVPPRCRRTAVNSPQPPPPTHSAPKVNPGVDLSGAVWRTLVMRSPRTWKYDRNVKVRLLALGLAAWVAAYAWVYVASMRDQGSTPYWWYVAIVGAGAVPPMLAAAGLRSRSVLICGAVILGIAAVLALPSIGMLLLPAVIAAAAVAFLSPRRIEGRG